MKCMNDEEKKRLRLLTKGFELGVDWNWRGKEVFWEKKGLDREKREKDWKFEMRNDLGRTLNIYRSVHLNRSRGIEKVLTAKLFDGLRRYRASISQTKSSKKKKKKKAWWIRLSIERYRAKPKKPQ